MSRVSVVAEFWEFLRYRKKYWMLPIVIVLMLLAGLAILVSAYPAAAPFLYTLG